MSSSIEVDGRVVALTSLDKVLFPDSGITKGDLVTYYLRIADVLLPHVRDRHANLQRFPGGIRSGFFQQDASDHFPDWIRTVELTVEHRKAKRRGRLYIDTDRNGYAQTLVAPYSVRARPGAPVATPLWTGTSSGGSTPRDYTIHNVLRRLGQKPDPWMRMDEEARPLAEAQGRLGAPPGGAGR